MVDCNQQQIKTDLTIIVGYFYTQREVQSQTRGVNGIY